MTFTSRLEQADGTPAEPPTIRSAVKFQLLADQHDAWMHRPLNTAWL